jgi:predicted MFS family arabinose efflux permease
MEALSEPQKAGLLSAVVRARIAVSIAFFILGAGAGIWAVHIPIVKARLGIDPAILGFALLSLACGAVLAMPLAGWAMAHAGSRLPTASICLAYTLLIPTPILSPSVIFLFVAMFFFGAMMGGLDVAANVQAAEVEKARGQPTMSSFHGFFSVGALAGSLIGAGAIAIGWANGGGAVAAAAVFLGLCWYVVLNLWHGEPHVEGGPRVVLPTGAALGLGMLAFLCFAIEGAVTDWSALYLKTDKLASDAGAASGYVLFSLAMVACRLTGDWTVARLGGWWTMVLGGLLMALGLVLAILSPWILVSAVGFALVGAGAANTVPVAFSASARIPGLAPSVGVAAVTTLGYSGFLVVPPVLGLVANAWGLSASLGLVALMAIATAAGGAMLLKR